jgi:hypothetical protein
LEAKDVWTSPFPGLRHLHRTTSTPLNIHALEVDLCNPGVSLLATPPNEGRSRSSVFGANNKLHAVINAAFYNTSTFVPIGLAMGNGQHWTNTADSSTTNYFASGRENRVSLAYPEQVLSNPEIWMRDVVSGIGVLVRDGQVVQDTVIDHLTARHPRTGLGLSADGFKLYLVVVDGRRQGVSIGVTTRQLGEIMKELGAWKAINLDGGGSSTMWLQGRGVVNLPSDGSERVVANHLGVSAINAADQPSLCCVPQAVAGAEHNRFKDLPTSHWAYDAVLVLANKGIVSGCQAQPLLFCPECRLKRDQIAKLLVSAMSQQVLERLNPSFHDVPRSHWAYGYIERLVELGITSGCSTNPPLFCPDQSVIRWQVALFLQRALKLPLFKPNSPSFIDLPTDHIAYGAVEALAAKGIIHGCSSNPPRFCTDRAMTRAEAAVVIARAFGLLDKHEEKATTEQPSHQESPHIGEPPISEEPQTDDRPQQGDGFHQPDESLNDWLPDAHREDLHPRWENPHTEQQVSDAGGDITEAHITEQNTADHNSSQNGDKQGPLILYPDSIQHTDQLSAPTGCNCNLHGESTSPHHIALFWLIVIGLCTFIQKSKAVKKDVP